MPLIAACLTTTIIGAGEGNLWEMARAERDLLAISTLFPAEDVREHLSTDEGLQDAVDWCRASGVTHVFIETFRSGYTAEREALVNARDRFREEGFEVSGCVTPTVPMGKEGTGWDLIACYTNAETQRRLKEIFEYTASIFDEIMIDDFLFVDCQCEECVEARGGQSWVDYRRDLMVGLSRSHILEASKAVNPGCRVIIKYPQWYDDFHERGYVVDQQTEDYDRIWVGTETRNYDDERWGGTPQYEAYFIMRWLGRIGGDKCGGGWFDPYGTTEDTYQEQARNTVLAGAREALLFCYGSLLRGTGPANVEAFREELPGLFELAKLVEGREPRGLLAIKPPNSPPGNERRVFDFVGMIGFPLVPVSRWEEVEDSDDPLFLSYHALHSDAAVDGALRVLSDRGGLVTGGFQANVGWDIPAGPVRPLPVEGDPKRLLDLPQAQLDDIRDAVLGPAGITFHAPSRVALCLLDDDYAVIQNFRDEPVEVEFADEQMDTEDLEVALVLQRTPADVTLEAGAIARLTIPPRTLVALTD